MIFGLLKLRKIYEDFNGRREGVNIFDGTGPTTIAHWLGFPYREGRVEYFFVREPVGWLVEETPSTLKVLWDRSVGKLPHERESVESGLVILKSAVLEVRRLKELEK